MFLTTIERFTLGLKFISRLDSADRRTDGRTGGRTGRQAGCAVEDEGEKLKTERIILFRGNKSRARTSPACYFWPDDPYVGNL